MSNFARLCAAALAGSLIGICYERMPQIPQWPSMMKTATADSRVGVPRSHNARQNFDVGLSKPKDDVIDQLKATENLKHSSRFGLPSNDNIRLFNDFLLSYDRRLRAPAWVLEHMTPEKLSKNLASRDKSSFHEDATLHPYFTAKLSDFKHSGYDRGHMAAAGNHKISQDDLDQTFTLSNISPQAPQLNQGIWERLESYVRFVTKRSKNLWVVSGPLYLPHNGKDGYQYVTYRVIGDTQVSVPTHYFKVFLAEKSDGRFVLEAFLFPNHEIPSDKAIDDFRVRIPQLDSIERASGVIFFNQLPRDKVEQPNMLTDGFTDDPSRRQKRLTG